MRKRENGKKNVKEFTADKPQSLKEFTDNTYAQGSFFWEYLLRNREIRVNGKRTGENVRLLPGDRVAYYLSPAQEGKSAFAVLYEDGNLLIADKESGVNSEAVFAALNRERECFFVHRLDRNTRGLIAFAENAAAERALSDAFRQRRVEKVYEAVCFGRFPKEGDVLTAWLKKDAVRARVRIFDRPAAGAEKIVTEYRVKGREGEGTLVEVVLHTGKTHQIRAHLAHIGCPVAGDTKYGDAERNGRYKLTRQCLVAKRLTLHADGALGEADGRTFVSRFSARDIFLKRQ